MDIASRTAIALQEHAEWRASCNRAGVGMLHSGQFSSDGCAEQWLAWEQRKVTALYELARHYALEASETNKLGRAVGEFLYSPDGAAFEKLDKAHNRWMEAE